MFSNNNIFIIFFFSFFRTNDKKYFDKDKKFKSNFYFTHLWPSVLECFRWIYFSSRLFLFIFYFLFWLNKIDLRSAVRQILLLWERTMRGRAKDEWKKRWFQLNSERNRRADRERDVHYSKDSRRLTLLRPLLPRSTAGYRFNGERRVDATDKFYFIPSPSPPLSYSFIHSINPPRLVCILLHPITRTISHWYH